MICSEQCFFFQSAGFCFFFHGFLFLGWLSAVSIMTKKPQSNQGRILILASWELLLLLHASAVMGQFSAGALLEAGAGVRSHTRDKVQRTFSNAACTGVYTQMGCGSACNHAHAWPAASALPVQIPREIWDGMDQSSLCKGWKQSSLVD